MLEKTEAGVTVTHSRLVTLFIGRSYNSLAHLHVATDGNESMFEEGQLRQSQSATIYVIGLFLMALGGSFGISFGPDWAHPWHVVMMSCGDSGRIPYLVKVVAVAFFFHMGM